MKIVKATCPVYSNETLREVSTPKPFLKWVGGKRQLLRALIARVPTVTVSGNTYFEPFVGGGALFFEDGYRWPRAVLGDTNKRLIRTYAAIRDNVEDVIEDLRRRAYSEKEYYTTRANSPDNDCGDVSTAAWMIYLNRCGFNGLYRVNKKGEFNVPFGRCVNPKICDAENLRACSAALQSVSLITGDFETTCARAKKGDFVYFDPPYMPVSATSDFTSYTVDGFTGDDQTRLARFALKLKSRGVYVMLSNSIAAKTLYEHYGFKVDVVSARRNVNSKASKRGAVEEIIVT